MRCPKCGLDNGEKSSLEFCYRCKPTFRAKASESTEAICIVKKGQTVKTYYGEFTSWHPKPVEVIINEVL